MKKDVFLVLHIRGADHDLTGKGLPVQMGNKGLATQGTVVGGT